jgi:hypothetical protein
VCCRREEALIRTNQFLVNYQDEKARTLGTETPFYLTTRARIERAYTTKNLPTQKEHDSETTPLVQRKEQETATEKMRRKFEQGMRKFDNSREREHEDEDEQQQQHK